MSDDIETLRKAIKPFAEIGQLYLPASEMDNSPFVTVSDDKRVALGSYTVTVGELRAIARAYGDDE